MRYTDNNTKVGDIKIAYIGGGSRSWAWGLMSDLITCDDISGDVYLYDIDYDAAKTNEAIGNKYNSTEGAKTVWNYHAAKTPKEALSGADFVIISILPGTFDEMESDVHTPEKYGIYQSVGDTTVPGGIIRAMRTIPMYEVIAGYIKEFCPDAWVISYTNPMTLCVRTLYRVFPEIKAFGCCHEEVEEIKFRLTPVSHRKAERVKRVARAERLKSGEEAVTIKNTGEEGTSQIRALLGLGDLVTNVNIPNRCQIPNLPLGAVVETNAVFRAGSLTPVFAGEIPKSILPLVSRICTGQENISAVNSRARR